MKLVLLNLVPKRHGVNPQIQLRGSTTTNVMVTNGDAPTKGFTTNGQYFQGVVKGDVV